MLELNGNIPLHNKLIRSILKNAYTAKTPPLIHEKFVLNQTGASTNTFLHGNKPLSLPQSTTPASPNQINGDVLPLFLHKKRTEKSPLGSNGRADELQLADISIKKNGVTNPSGLKKPMQHVQSGFARKPPKHPCGAISLFFYHICEQRKCQFEGAEREERKRLKINDLNSIQAPIGVSYGPSSVGGK